MISNVVRIARGLVHLAVRTVVPPMCAHCQTFLSHDVPLCDACAALINPLFSKTIEINARYVMTVFAVSRYVDPIKSLILAKSGSHIAATRPLGRLMWDMTNVQHVPFDCIVPVPLHWTRFASRGYNQAEEIAKEISSYSGKPVINLVSRARRTPFQSKVAADERADNVRNAFLLRVRDLKEYEGKHILIVDDLMTTGETLKAAGKIVAQLKPSGITAVVAARVV